MRLTHRLRGRRVTAAVAIAAALAVFGASAAAGLSLLGINLNPSPEPPAITFRFPDAGGGNYNGAAWATGCKPAGICGSASDAQGVRWVRLAVRDLATGLYWNGTGFAAPSSVWHNANVSSSLLGYTWNLPLKLPPDGNYQVYARAQDGNGQTTTGTDTRWVRFGIDTDAPPPPRVLLGPDPITTLTVAVFNIAEVAADIDLRCQLDDGAEQRCEPRMTYAHLELGEHCLRLWAVDSALNVSAKVSVCWLIETREFPITGTLAGPFFPGMTQPINLVITNPYKFDLHVHSATVTLQPGTTLNGGPNPGCVATEHFAVTQDLEAEVTIPAGTTRSLQQLGVPQSQWPQLAMHNLPTNQDACQGSDIHLGYSAAGTKAGLG